MEEHRWLCALFHSYMLVSLFVAVAQRQCAQTLFLDGRPAAEPVEEGDSLPTRVMRVVE